MLHDMLYRASDTIGLIGVFLILTAYYLLNTHRLTALNLSYQWINLAGSILILFSLCFHINVPSVVIEIFWILISILGIRRALAVRARKSAESAAT